MDKPKRHGCLTAFLIVMIVANVLTALIYLFASDTVRQTYPDAPAWIFVLLAVMGLLNVAFAVALFQWKRWGFYGFVATAAVAFVVNLYIGLGIGQALFGLAGVAILYAVLQIGDDRKAWPHLE